MTKRKLTLWASMLAMLFFAGAVSARQVSNETLDTLLEVSGIYKQAHAIPLMVTAAVERTRTRANRQKDGPLTDEDFDELEKSMGNAFQADDILKSTGDAIRKKVSEADAKKLIAWYESKEGRQITDAQKAAYLPAEQKDMIAHARALLADKPRVAIARRLKKLLHATGDAMKFRERAALALYTAVSQKLQPNKPVDVKAIKARLDARMAQRRPIMEKATTLVFVHMYRKLDMATLKRYEAFLKTPQARRFNDSARAGLMAGLDQALARIGGDIGEIAAQHQKPQTPTKKK